jgi:hypothetical protein
MSPAVDVFEVRCPLCTASIALPRRSPLGIYGGLAYLPTDKWPITFWCTAREQLCEVAPQFHRKTVAMQDPSPRWVSLWAIECECVHENCGKHHAIYTRDYSTAPERDIRAALWQFVGSKTLGLACDSTHDLILQPEKIWPTRFDF